MEVFLQQAIGDREVLKQEVVQRIILEGPLWVLAAVTCRGCGKEDINFAPPTAKVAFMALSGATIEAATEMVYVETSLVR